MRCRNTRIESRDISVVVQGPIYEGFTQKCLDSIRRELPEAQIILSTWRGSNVSGLEFDLLIQSEDPGTTVYDHTTNAVNNINRQLLSTLEGLKLADRRYVLKFRSDVELLDNRFLNYFEVYDALSPAEYFARRPLVCNYYCRNARVMPLAYHITDWLMFGLLEDVKKYYSVPLQSPEEGEWFTCHKKESRLFRNFNCRYTPEQYICVKFLQQMQSVSCDCYYDCSDKIIAEAENFIAKNLVILNYGQQFNIKFLKYNPNRYLEKYTLLSFYRWETLFFHYCMASRAIRFYTFVVMSQMQRFLFKMRLLAIDILIMTGTKEKLKKILTKLGNLL